MTEIFTTIFCWLLILITIVVGICGCIILVLSTIDAIKAIKEDN